MVAKKPRTMAADHHDTIHKLHQLQEHLDKVNAKARGERMEIHHKYKKIRDPVYARRNNIISCIPDFWLSVLLHHPVLEDMLTEYDQKILGYLDSLVVDDLPDPRKGYCITFTFKANPYFVNTNLTKTVEFSDDGTMRSIGTSIRWKKGKWPKGKRSNYTKGNKRPLPWQSFIKWISDPRVDMNQDVVAEIIKEDIWPDPIELLNNLNGEDEQDDDSDDEEDEDDDKDGDADADADGSRET